MRTTSLALTVLILSSLSPTHVAADTDDAVFGPPEPQSVEFVPDRRIDPLALLPIEVNGRWGHADRRGDVVVEPRFDWTDYYYGPVHYTTENRIELHWLRARYANGDRFGKLTFYETVSRRMSNMKSQVLDVADPDVKRDRPYGIFTVIDEWENNQRRQRLIKPGISRAARPIVYDELLRMTDNMAAVRNGDLCGYVDSAGKLRIPFQFAQARSFHDGYAVVQFPPAQRSAWAVITKTGKFQFLDKAGDIEELRSYHESLAAVKARGKWGFLDKRQAIAIAPDYDEVRDFANGLAAVRIGEAWGYIDKRGERVAWGFQGAWDFDTPEKNGLGNDSEVKTAKLGLIKQDGLFGYIDRAGRIVISPRYENALPFFRGVARVKCGNSFAYIDRDGQIIWDPRRVAQYGVRGLNLPAAVAPRWSGLTDANGTHSEPFPFEFDVDDVLPRTWRVSPQSQQQGQPQDQTPEPLEPSPADPAKDTATPRRGSNR